MPFEQHDTRRAMGTDADTRTSGDLLADRRFAYAEALSAEGDHAAAADLFGQVTAIVPDWAPAWLARGLSEAEAGRLDAAITALEQAMALDPGQSLGASLHLARLQSRAVDTMPRAYVAALFDQYADRFDAHLLGTLRYRGPDLVVAALDRFAGRRSFAAALDIGCGTGLMAKAMGHRVDAIDGIDLSQAMIDQAGKTGLYRHLRVADLSAAGTDPADRGAYDLILAADVFVYVGALGPVFETLAPRLADGGHLAFTVQHGEGEDFALGADMRFRHAPRYLRETLDRAGLRVIAIEEGSTRRERGSDVPGLVVVATKA